jgi:hypothetical protein
MTVQKRPGSFQVAVAWLKSLPELAATEVATTLPQPKDWPGQDFVTVSASLGGMPSPYIATRIAVMQVDAWAKAPNSTRPAWNRASITAEAIRDACLGNLAHGIFTIPGGFLSADLHGVTCMAEPRRAGNDPAAIARYMLSLEFVFTPVGLVIV